MGRPGIMLYFDILEPIRVLSDADKGRLLVAMLEYGQTGKDPQFEGMLALAWGFVRPDLDRDEEAYENAKVQRNYAAFCKRRKSLKLPKIPFEEWVSMTDDERQRMATGYYEPLRSVDFEGSRYPTTTATPSTSTNTSTTTAAAATANAFSTAATENELKYFKGELGKGVVILSDQQVNMLLEQMGLDAFDHYVSKLANFIIKNDATVKSHYETVLRWWREDSNVH